MNRVPAVPLSTTVTPFDRIAFLRRHAKRSRHSLRRCYVDLFYSEQVPMLNQADKVLDLGGVRRESMPGSFNVLRFDLDVVCFNILPDANPNVLGIAEALPFRDHSFDTVICSEVLEHVRDPRVVLAEIARVTKSNGRLLATVPFLYHIHACPYDYGRYTDFFWRDALHNASFVLEQIERQGLYWSVVLDFFYVLIERSIGASRYWIWRNFLRVLLRWPLGWLRQWAVRYDAKLGRDQHPTLSMFTTGFGIVARRQTY